jgi:8-oxo-dGTP diphosphatase
MAHIHEKIDFTVSVFVVRENKVLLVHHRKLKKWLPVGGHIELDEDPEIAAIRETEEESGLKIKLIGERPPTSANGTRALIAPRFLDIHRISDTHEHIGMIYWATSESSDIRLAPDEHLAIQWFTKEDLDQLEPPITSAIKWYSLKALEEIDNEVS